jgi:hypothetical protein
LAAALAAGAAAAAPVRTNAVRVAAAKAAAFWPMVLKETLHACTVV